MKGRLHSPGQPINVQAGLDYDKYSTQDAIGERLTDLFTSGVIADSQELGENIPFEIVSAGGLNVNVGSGVALASGLVDSSDPTETGGERIHIPSGDTQAGKNWRRSPGGGPGSGTGTGPFKESEDGLGSYTATPESTWTRLIPLTDNTTNYVWIGYLHTIDPLVYLLHKYSSAKIYPNGLDGYDILVTTSPSTPSFNGNANYMLLGSVVTAAGVIMAISQSGMSYARTKSSRVGINIDTATPPATYSDGQTKFLDDHINAMGSGSGPSVANPHNQTLEDFGVDFGDVDLIQHRKNHHSKGIVGSEVTTTSSLYPQTDNATPVGGDLAMVFLKQLISGEELVLDGRRFTVVLPQLVAPVGAGAIGDTYASFPAGSANTYNIYVKIVGDDAVLDKKTSAVGANEYLVATVDWDGAAFTGNGGVPNVTTDDRAFGLTGTKDIQANSVTGDKIADGAVDTDQLASGAVNNAKVDAAAAIAYSKLNLTGGIVNADVNAAAAIAYSKLALTGSVVTGDLTDNSVTSQKLDEWDGASTAAQPNTGSGVKTAHIADGAVSEDKLDPLLLVSPTRTIMTSGVAATYTTPSGARQLRIRMVGGGGGGGAATTNSGSAGSATTFNAIDAAGGAGGIPTNDGNDTSGQGGAGGSGSASWRVPGFPGGEARYQKEGGFGGATLLGPGASGKTASGTAYSAPANTGGGGGGAVSNGGNSGGGGGGGGEYVEIIINSPAASYTYTIGAGGAGGAAGGFAGGAGGSGLIIVDELYR